MQGVKYFNGPNYHDFNRIIMTFSIILSGIWGKKYRFEKVYIYILKYPRLVNVEYALKYKASTGYLILLYSLTTYLLTCLHTSLFTEVLDVSSNQKWRISLPWKIFKYLVLKRIEATVLCILYKWPMVVTNSYIHTYLLAVFLTYLVRYKMYPQAK